MAGRSSSREFDIAFGVLKALTILTGFAATLVSLMAVVGVFSGNGWIRLVAALVVALAVPLVLIDRLLPEDDPERSRGLPTDVLALVWFGFALAFAGAGIRYTRGLLQHEAERLEAEGFAPVATVTYWVAGPSAQAATAAAAHGTHGAASQGAGTSANGAAADAAVGGADASAATPTAAGADAGTSASAAPQAERTSAELFRDLAPTVVTITAQLAEGQSGGTGFLLDAEGTVATNHHVIANAREVHVKLFDSTVVDQVELLADDAAQDLALLRIRAPRALTAVRLGDSDRVALGDHAIAIGNPLGLECTLTDEIVSPPHDSEGRSMIQLSVPVSPGNSGGPLFNMRGEVIGVTTEAVASGPAGRARTPNLAIPVNVLRPMIRSEYPQRRRFGDAA